MATAEFAVALPALLLVCALALSALGYAIDTLRCVDAARATARLLARGDPAEAALGQGRRLAPHGAQIRVSDSPDAVEVHVVAGDARGLSWLGPAAQPLRASADAVAAHEQEPAGGVP